MDILDSGILSLSVDQTGRQHLREAARWAWLLAILGFVFLGLSVIAGAFYVYYMYQLMAGFGGMGEITSSYGAGMVVGWSLYILTFSVLWFFPNYFLLRFAQRTNAALQTDDQPGLNSAFQTLKVLFRYVAVLTIIGLVLFVLVVLAGLFAFLNSGLS